MKAYSPARRRTIAAANTPKTGNAANARNDSPTARGTAVNRKRSPRRAATRPVIKTCDSSASVCTVKSSALNTRMRCVVSGNESATSRACSMYRKVLSVASSTTSNEMPSR
ncbi:hypothetical protein D3C72_1871640 [compost metagenome]